MQVIAGLADGADRGVAGCCSGQRYRFLGFKCGRFTHDVSSLNSLIQGLSRNRGSRESHTTPYGFACCRPRFADCRRLRMCWYTFNAARLAARNALNGYSTSLTPTEASCSVVNRGVAPNSVMFASTGTFTASTNCDTVRVRSWLPEKSYRRRRRHRPGPVRSRHPYLLPRARRCAP